MANEEGSSKKEFNIDEVFAFYSPELSIDNLRERMHDLMVELHKYIKMFRRLSKDYSHLKEDKEKIRIELEALFQTAKLYSNLETENERLKEINDLSTHKESLLASKI